jgi:uncharacterized protein
LTIDARPGRLRVDVTDLRLQPGATRKVELTTLIEDIAVGDVYVASDTPIHLDLVLEGIQGGIDVTGRVTTTWRGPCRRCLDDVEGDLVLDVHEIYAEDHVEGETYPVTKDSIDLGEMARDVLTLGLPLAPLCGPDCPGPAPGLFPLDSGDSTDADPSGLEERPRDPRWAALDELRSQFDEDSDRPGPIG